MTGEAVDITFEDVARDFRLGVVSAETLSLAFSDAVFFCRRGEEFAFQALGTPQRGIIPFYSSEESLARAEGPCAWFSATGLELIAMVPDGYGVVIDLGSVNQVALAPWAIRPQRETHEPQSASGGE